MAQSALIESDIKITCDRCGSECSEGYIERSFGQDPETGYIDIETVCASCNAEERGLCEHCKRDDATVTLGDERLCDGCYDDAMLPDSEDWDGE